MIFQKNHSLVLVFNESLNKEHSEMEYLSNSILYTFSFFLCGIALSALLYVDTE